MPDSGNDQVLRDSFARAMGKLIQFAADNNIKVLVFSLSRSALTQHQLYADGKSKLDGITKKSKHQLGRAIDLAVVKNKKPVWEPVEEYTKLGEYWESLKGTWGGRWTDPHDIYHFEM